MKSASFFCALAMLFYAFEMVVTELKLTKVSPLFLTFCYSLGVTFCSLCFLIFSGSKIVLPTQQDWFFVGLMILVSFVAARSHFQALYENAGAVRLAIYYCLMPVAAKFFLAIFRYEELNLRMLAALIFAALALYLIQE